MSTHSHSFVAAEAGCCPTSIVHAGWQTGCGRLCSSHITAGKFLLIGLVSFVNTFYLFTLFVRGAALARCRRCLVLSITWIMLNSKLYLISNNLLLSDEGSDRVPDRLPTQNVTIHLKKKKEESNAKQCERIVCPLADGLFFISRTVSADVWPALTCGCFTYHCTVFV